MTVDSCRGRVAFDQGRATFFRLRASLEGQNFHTRRALPPLHVPFSQSGLCCVSVVRPLWPVFLSASAAIGPLQIARCHALMHIAKSIRKDSHYGHFSFLASGELSLILHCALCLSRSSRSSVALPIACHDFGASSGTPSHLYDCYTDHNDLSSASEHTPSCLSNLQIFLVSRVWRILSPLS